MQQLFLLKALFFWKQPRRFGKAMKNGEMRYFRKKTWKWECGTAGSPSPLPYRSWLLSHFFFWYLQKRKTKAVIIRELKPVKQRRRRRQRERQKSNRFRLAKQQLCTLLHDHNVKVPSFTFCRRRGHKTTTFFFSFPELWYSPSEFNSKNNLPPFNELNEMEWARKRSRQSECTF